MEALQKLITIKSNHLLVIQLHLDFQPTMKPLSIPTSVSRGNHSNHRSSMVWMCSSVQTTSWRHAICRMLQLQWIVAVLRTQKSIWLVACWTRAVIQAPVYWQTLSLFLDNSRSGAWKASTDNLEIRIKSSRKASVLLFCFYYYYFFKLKIVFIFPNFL